MAKSRFDPNAVTVLLNDVTAFCGGAIESTEYHMRQLGIEAIEDWAGRRALRVGDARRVVETYRVTQTAHNDRWAAYQAFLTARREEAHRQRQEALRRDREQLARARDERARRVAERRLTEREAALAAAEAGREPSFEAWQATHGETP